MERRLADARPRLIELQERAVSDDPQIVSLCDEVYELCEKYGLCCTAQFHPNQVGFHPANRSTAGLEPQDIPKKLLAFKVSGFSFAETARATAIERPPGKKGDQYEQENVRVVKQSNGQLAHVGKNSLKIFSLTCGHTTQAARAALAGCVCSLPEISENGRISESKLSKTDPGFQRLFSAGMPWRVLVHQLEEQFPKIIELIIESDNVVLKAAKADSVIEVLWKVHRCCDA